MRGLNSWRNTRLFKKELLLAHNSRLKLGLSLQFMTSRDPIPLLILYALVRVRDEMAFFFHSFSFSFLFWDDPSLHIWLIFYITCEKSMTDYFFLATVFMFCFVF